MSLYLPHLLSFFRGITVSILANIIKIIFLVCICSSHVFGDEGSHDFTHINASQAYKKGKKLRSQFYFTEAQRYLKFSADSGHPDAAYLYAIDLLKMNNSTRSNDLGRKYMQKAAFKGNRHAMKYLYEDGLWLTKKERGRWRENYYNSLIALGKDRPQAALYELSLYFSQSEPKLSEHYLNLSILFKYPPALMEQANRYQLGGSSFLISEDREAAVRKLYQQAAETGYIPAIKTYVQLLEESGNYQLAFEWREKALHKGCITSLASVAFIYSGINRNEYSFVDIDNVKAKAYLSLYIDSVSDKKFSKLYTNIEKTYSDIEQQMTSEQKHNSLLIEESLRNNLVFFYHDKYLDI